ncbi:coiled-coil domain-containing protein 130 homolog isoform X1 [Folsomia candida]|uniref:coiled-coil domain-containing protein 130 homolog isoform X1 n=2 Tax=Folsomia candida TaxID=158441 RepID=UPI000B8EF549|nr:coiled-coil domain-containing protein 130 homolog isoform X1 [Folsomia candida]
MGERKGTNKYYPPDYDPKKGGLNAFLGTHALRERARKLHLGILIIRFEMPYNMWCDGCKNHIGMGVRYNAEKTKIGMYYSTPVYQFRMKCHLCDNYIEMKTDPGNLDYVIVSGGRRQENRWDPTENGQVVPDDKRVIRQLADDAMFKLQHGVDDQSKLKSVAPTIGKLEDLQERMKDDYSANKALRDIFRTRKKEIKVSEDKDNEFLRKRSLNIPLLEESEEDAKIASLIRLQPSQSIEERQKRKRLEIDQKCSFPFPLPSSAETASTNDSSETKIKTEPDDPLFPSFTTTKVDNFNPTRVKLLDKQRSSLGINLVRRIKSENVSVPSSPSPSQSSSMSSDSALSPPPVTTLENDNVIVQNNLNSIVVDISNELPTSLTNGAASGGLSLISCDYGSTSSEDE